MSALKLAVAQCERSNLAAMTEAFERCNTQFERDQCRRAYADKFWNDVDVLSQLHGLAPMLRTPDGRVTNG